MLWHARADHYPGDRSNHLRPRKLPELGKSLGKSIHEFKKASTELQNTLEQEIKIEEQKDNAAKVKAEVASATLAPDVDHNSQTVSRS